MPANPAKPDLVAAKNLQQSTEQDDYLDAEFTTDYFIIMTTVIFSIMLFSALTL